MEVHLVIVWTLCHLQPVFSPKAVMGLTVGLVLQAPGTVLFCSQNCRVSFPHKPANP